MPLPAAALRPFRVVRRTDRLVADQAVNATLILLGKCPPHAAFVEVKLTGDDLTGTVDVVGALNGGAVTETLTFTGPVAGSQASLTTCNLYDCVTAVTPVDLADEVPTPQIRARFVGSGGEPVHVNCDLEECVMAYKEERGFGAWSMQPGGATQKAPEWIAFDDLYEFEPRRGDIFIELKRDDSDGDQWEITGKINHLGATRPHHWECGVTQRQTQDITERTP